MTEQMNYIVDLSSVKFDATKTNSGWLHVFTLGTVWDRRYGFFELTPARMKRFADNVNERILGTDVPIDFSHMDGPDGERAAGWGTQAVTQDPTGSGDGGLWLWVDWNPRAAQEIRDGEWRYASAMFSDVWVDARGHQHQDVLLGTAITNHPVLKDLTPINLSDYNELAVEYLGIMEPDLSHFDFATVDNSKWDGNAAMTNCKGAADYRAICAGRREGDPENRETWTLPHHNKPGAPPNANGVRNALARLPQTEGLVNKDGAKRHLEAHQRAMKALSDDLGGEMDVKLFATIFGLGDDATEEQIVTKAKEFVDTVNATKAAEEKAKQFAEAFPEEAARLAEQEKQLADLYAENRLTSINADITKLTETGVNGFALPAAIIDDLRELRQELSAEADSRFNKLLTDILEAGLVELGEIGSSGKEKPNSTTTLSDAISDYKKEHPDASHRQAYAAVKAEHPELVDEHVGSKGGDDN